MVDLLLAQAEAAQLLVLNKARRPPPPARPTRRARLCLTPPRPAPRPELSRLFPQVERLDAASLELLVRLLAALNPAAAIVQASYARVPLASLLAPPTPRRSERPGAAEAEAAEPADGAPACVECADGEARLPLPRRLQLAVSRFAYERRRPFHPLRLAQRVLALMPTARPRGSSLAPEPAPAPASSSDRPSPLARLLRSKGFAWLASQPATVYRWSYAGCHFELTEHCELRASPAVEGAAAERPEAEAGGALGQRLVFIGLSLPEGEIVRLLDSCLLADWELPYFEKGLPPPEAPPEAPPPAEDAERGAGPPRAPAAEGGAGPDAGAPPSKPDVTDRVPALSASSEPQCGESAAAPTAALAR